MPDINRAIQIAEEAHKDQRDKNGKPYIGHVLRVSEMCRTDEEKICGLLHDVVEDSDITFDDLRREGFSEEIISALICLTKVSEDEDYDRFIQRISVNPLAVNVKLCDLCDNMDIRRLDQITPRDAERLNKYLRAYRFLSAKREEFNNRNV